MYHHKTSTKKRKQAQETQSKRFDTEKLKLPSYREQFNFPVTNKYNALENLLESDENTSSSEQICNNIEQVYIEVADVGKKKKRPCRSERSRKLIDERACIHSKGIETRSEKTVHIKEQYRAIDREVTKQT